MRPILLTAVMAALGATILVLLIAASTHWLDSALSIGTHQSAGSKLSVISTDGTHRTTFVRDPGMTHWGPAWVRYGRNLVYSFGVPSRHADQLVVANSDGTGHRVVTNNGRENYLAVWSPDGTRLAYIAQVGTKTSTAELMVIGVDGRDQRRLTTNHAWEYGASWSPDGRRIAFGSKQGGVWRVWVMNANGSGSHPIPGTQKGNAPDWSPDGRSLAFTSNRTGNDNIYRVTASGGTARRLTTGPCHSDNARWSPDGRHLVYAVFCDHGWNDIYVMDADGSHARNLTRTLSMDEEVPAWLPDGRHVGFTVFQVERDSLWPGPVLDAIGFGVVLGLIVGALMLVRGRRPIRAGAQSR